MSLRRNLVRFSATGKQLSTSLSEVPLDFVIYFEVSVVQLLDSVDILSTELIFLRSSKALP